MKIFFLFYLIFFGRSIDFNFPLKAPPRAPPPQQRANSGSDRDINDQNGLFWRKNPHFNRDRPKVEPIYNDMGNHGLSQKQLNEQKQKEQLVEQKELQDQQLQKQQQEYQQYVMNIKDKMALEVQKKIGGGKISPFHRNEEQDEEEIQRDVREPHKSGLLNSIDENSQSKGENPQQKDDKLNIDSELKVKNDGKVEDWVQQKPQNRHRMNNQDRLTRHKIERAPYRSTLKSSSEEGEPLPDNGQAIAKGADQIPSYPPPREIQNQFKNIAVQIVSDLVKQGQVKYQSPPSSSSNYQSPPSSSSNYQSHSQPNSQHASRGTFGTQHRGYQNKYGMGTMRPKSGTGTAGVGPGGVSIEDHNRGAGPLLIIDNPDVMQKQISNQRLPFYRQTYSNRKDNPVMEINNNVESEEN